MIALKVVIFAVLQIVAICLHLSNSVIIIWRKELHKVQNYVILNLTLSDVLMMVLIVIKGTTIDATLAIQMTFAVSMLTTVLRTVDRFLVVTYGFTSHHIALLLSRKILIVTLLMIWVSASCLAYLPLLINDQEKQNLCVVCINATLGIGGSVFLLVGGAIIRYRRNMEEVRLVEENINFGTQLERRHFIQNLATSIVNMLRLNMVTAVLVTIAKISMLIDRYGPVKNTPAVNAIAFFMHMLYMLSNPIIYILTTTDLKEQYKILFGRQRGEDTTLRQRPLSLETPEVQETAL